MQKKQIYVVLPNDTAEKVDIVLSNVEIGGKENGQMGSTGENWQDMRWCRLNTFYFSLHTFFTIFILSSYKP